MHRLAAAPGSPDLADAAVFAFYPSKQTTTGEGGMIVTDDDRVAALCNSMRNQGRGETGAWLAHDRLSYNYRLDEMSAVLGMVEMGRSGEILEKRDHVMAGLPAAGIGCPRDLTSIHLQPLYRKQDYRGRGGQDYVAEAFEGALGERVG